MDDMILISVGRQMIELAIQREQLHRQVLALQEQIKEAQVKARQAELAKAQVAAEQKPLPPPNLKPRAVK